MVRGWARENGVWPGDKRRQRGQDIPLKPRNRKDAKEA